MNLRQYILVFLLGTGAAFASWILVVTRIDPTASDLLAYGAFYFSLFVALTGFFTTIATLVRSVLAKNRDVEHIVTASLRQSILLAMLFLGALLLLSVQLLAWWTVLLLALAVGIIEAIFLTMSVR